MSNIERANPVTRPRILVEQFLTDPGVVSALLGNGGSVSLDHSLKKVAKTIRGYDDREKAAFAFIVISQVIDNPDENVKKAAFELFKAPALDTIPTTALSHSLSKAVGELTQRASASRIEVELVQSLVYHASTQIPNDVKKALLKALHDMNGKVTIRSGTENVAHMFPAQTRRESNLAISREDREREEREEHDEKDAEARVIQLPVKHDIADKADELGPQSGQVITLFDRRQRLTSRERVEARKEAAKNLQRECLGLTPPQMEEKLVELRNAGYFRNFELMMILGLSDSTLSKMISKLTAEGRIKSKAKKK